MFKENNFLKINMLIALIMRILKKYREVSLTTTLISW